MKSVSLYGVGLDYREFLKRKVESDSKEIKGLITKMAEAAGCQRSHLSRVLNSHLHLTLDQAYGLADFWGLNEEESTYFMRLVEYGRAGNPKYRQKLARELARIKQSQEDISQRLKQPSIGVQEAELFYYSAWHWSAIHIIVSIPKYQTSQAISQRLNLPHEMVVECLQTLEKYKLVARVGERWVFSSQTVHLSKHSPLSSVQQGNWRQQAVLKSQSPRNDGVHYTTVQSLSEKDFQEIKRLVLQTIDDYQKIAGPSKEEELVCLAMDFFRIGSSQ